MSTNEKKEYLFCILCALLAAIAITLLSCGDDYTYNYLTNTEEAPQLEPSPEPLATPTPCHHHHKECK